MSLLESIGGVLSGAAAGAQDPSVPFRELMDRKRRKEESKTRMFEEAEKLKIGRESDKTKRDEARQELTTAMERIFGNDLAGREKVARMLAASEAGGAMDASNKALMAMGAMDSAKELGTISAQSELEKARAAGGKAKVENLSSVAQILNNIPGMSALAERAKLEAQQKTNEGISKNAGLVADTDASDLALRQERNKAATLLLPDETRVKQGELEAALYGVDVNKALRDRETDLRARKTAQGIEQTDAMRRALSSANPEQLQMLLGTVRQAPSAEEIQLSKDIARIRANQLDNAPQDMTEVVRKWAGAPDPNNVPTAVTGPGTGGASNARNAGTNPAAGLSTVPDGSNPPANETGRLPQNKSKAWRSYSTVPSID